MIDLLTTHPWAVWVSLGGILLIAEMLGTNGYMLWSGVAAVVTGLISALLPISWEWQGICFALLTLFAAWGWWRWLSRRQAQRGGWAPNQRGHDLVGRCFVLDSPLVNGRGNLRIGDSSWPVAADSELPAGTRVIVTGVEGITLRVSPHP